jgi:hypothetical protein
MKTGQISSVFAMVFAVTTGACVAGDNEVYVDKSNIVSHIGSNQLGPQEGGVKVPRSYRASGYIGVRSHIELEPVSTQSPCNANAAFQCNADQLLFSEQITIPQIRRINDAITSAAETGNLPTLHGSWIRDGVFQVDGADIVETDARAQSATAASL